MAVGLALALAAASGPARAVAPTGVYRFTFGGPQSIWVLEGESGCEPDIGCVDVPVVCDPRGSCAGTGNLLGLDGGIRARLRGNDRTGITRVAIGARFEGVFAEGLLQGFEGRLTRTHKGQIDASGASVARSRTKVCLQGLGCESVTQPGGFEVSPGEGDWALDLLVASVDGTTMGGWATASISDDIAYDYTVTGRYDAAKDVSSLTLVPDAASLGSSIRFKNVRMIPGGLQGEIRYKILGHVGKTVVTGVPPSSFFPLPFSGGGGFSGLSLRFLPPATSAP